MSYTVPHPDVAAFENPNERNVVRRLYERVANIETVTNLQSYTGGRKAPRPPLAKLGVSVNSGMPGHAYIRIVNPEFLGTNQNPIVAPIRHWLRASPNVQFNGNITDFGITHQTYFDISELGSGAFVFQLRSTFDGKTFNAPVSSGKIVIP
jgi:hypothetical protein